MIKKLFIGGLKAGTDEMALARLVGPYGDIMTIQIVRDKFSGQPKGFAFVEMVSREAADHAIDGLDGKIVDGNELVVHIAEDKPKPAPGFRRGGGSFGARPKRPR